MKCKIIISSITLFITWLVYQSAYAQTNIILKESDIAGIKIDATWMQEPLWCTGATNAKGRLIEFLGVRQFVLIQGVKAEIFYGEFSSAEEAHQAAEFHSKTQASVFHYGSWDGAQNKSVADETWYSHDPFGIALLYRSGRTCILICCCSGVPENQDKDISKQMQVVELVATNVNRKIPILEAKVTLKPEALEVSPGVLTAFVKLPDGYPVKNITSVTCDGAKADKMMTSDDQKEMIIKFRRQDIEAALARIRDSLDPNFVVRGTWTGATETDYFKGTATIKKIVSPKSK